MMIRVLTKAASFLAACFVTAALLPCVVSAAGTSRKKKVTSFNLGSVKQSEDHIHPPPPNEGRQLWEWSHYTTATDSLALKDLKEWEKQVAEQRKQEERYLKKLLADERTLNELLEHHEQARELVNLVQGTCKAVSFQAGNTKYALASNVAKASIEAAEAAVREIEENIGAIFPLHDGNADDRPGVQTELNTQDDNTEQDLGLLIKKHVASRAVFQHLQISRYIAGRGASSLLSYNDSSALRRVADNSRARHRGASPLLLSYKTAMRALVEAQSNIFVQRKRCICVRNFGRSIRDRYMTFLKELDGLPSAVLTDELAKTPNGRTLIPAFAMQQHPNASASFPVSSAALSVLVKHIGKMKVAVKAYTLRKGVRTSVSFFEALERARSDPEPSHRRDSLISVEKAILRPGVREELAGGLRVLWDILASEKRAKGFMRFPRERNLDLELRLQAEIALTSAVSNSASGIYKRIMRLRKSMLKRSEGLKTFTWSDHAALPVDIWAADKSLPWEEAFTIVAKSMKASAPPMFDLLKDMVEQQRISVSYSPKSHQQPESTVPEGTSEVKSDMSFQGNTSQAKVESYFSPLSGTVVAVGYSSKGNCRAMAHSLWKQAVIEKIYLLHVLEPVSAARAAERSIANHCHSTKKGCDYSSLSGVIKDYAGERSVGGASVFDLNEDRLGDRAAFVAETFALWGEYLAFLHELQRTSLPQRKLILLVAYLEDVIGTLVRGFFLDKFQEQLEKWAASNGTAADLEGTWMRLFKEFFGREGDVFDSFEGVRTQWVFAGIDGDLLLGVERRSFGSAKARAAHIVAFLALNKVSQERILSAPATKLQMKTHDSALQKDVRNRQSNLLVTRALSTSEKASNIEKFISVWMNEGLEIALREFGANVNKSNFWSDALHKTIDELLREMERLAAELSYTPKLRDPNEDEEIFFNSTLDDPNEGMP